MQKLDIPSSKIIPGANHMSKVKSVFIEMSISTPYEFYLTSLSFNSGKSNPWDGEHPTARFSVSTGVKKENFMRIKVNKNIKRIIEVYHSKYFIAKFAFK